MSDSTGRISIVLCLLVTTLLTGCAAIRAMQARNAHLQRATQQYVYDTPCKKIWPSARLVLFEAGYAVNNKGSRTLETEWKYDDDERSRYLVQGTSPKPGTCRVRFEHMEKDESGYTSTTRDWEMEWRVLQKVAPRAASKIRREAERRASRARGR